MQRGFDLKSRASDAKAIQVFQMMVKFQHKYLGKGIKEARVAYLSPLQVRLEDLGHRLGHPILHLHTSFLWRTIALRQNISENHAVYAYVAHLESDASFQEHICCRLQYLGFVHCYTGRPSAGDGVF